MNMAIRIHRHGGPEEMLWETVAAPSPGDGEVLVRHTSIGVNFSDINLRRGGFYANIHPQFPLVLGNEAAGVVEAVGPTVTSVVPGDRVAYAGSTGEFYEDTGAYCELRVLPAHRLVRIPDDVTDEQASAILLKGSTASLIIKRLYAPAPGDTVLVHAAASGVGSLLCQWASSLGATVIGTVGSEAKRPIAFENGCRDVINYRERDFVEAVAQLTPRGLTAVLDGVGKDTFLPSLKLLGPFGKAVNYGNASGSVPPLDVQSLAVKSLTVSRAGVIGHIRDPDSLQKAATELFDLVGQRVLRPLISRTYPLREAADAHRAVEQAAITGSILLIP